MRSKIAFSICGSLNDITNTAATQIREARSHRPGDPEAPMTGLHLSDMMDNLEHASVAAEMLAGGIDETLRLLRMEKADTERGG